MAGERGQFPNPMGVPKMISKAILKYAPMNSNNYDRNKILGALYKAQRQLQAEGLGRLSVTTAGKDSAFMAVSGCPDLDEALARTVVAAENAVYDKMASYQIIGAMRSAETPDLSMPSAWANLMREPDADVTPVAIEIAESLHAERIEADFVEFARGFSGVALPGEPA